MKNAFKKTIFVIFFIIFWPLSSVFADGEKLKTKFYNFDDLLINGEYKKPQVLFIDNRQKVKFEKLLKLKKNFLQKLKNTQNDPSLR